MHKIYDIILQKYKHTHKICTHPQNNMKAYILINKEINKNKRGNIRHYLELPKLKVNIRSSHTWHNNALNIYRVVDFFSGKTN